MPEHSGAGEEPQLDNNNKSTEPSGHSLDSNALIEALITEVRALREELKGPLVQATKKDPPSKLEKGQRYATVVGVPIALIGFLLAAYSFTYTGEMQAEDAAYRAIQEHQKLRTELPSEDMSDGSDMSEWVSYLERHPERINDEDGVPTDVFMRYDSLADHGLGTVEWIYKTRVNRNTVLILPPVEKALRLSGLRPTEKSQGWESSVEYWIWEYRAAIYADLDRDSLEDSNFGWCDYHPDFVDLIKTTLEKREREGDNNESLYLALSIPSGESDRSPLFVPALMRVLLPIVAPSWNTHLRLPTHTTTRTLKASGSPERCAAGGGYSARGTPRPAPSLPSSQRTPPSLAARPQSAQ